MKVAALQGDTVDMICHRHLGSTALVEAVLTLNPGIAALGTILPMGTELHLPDAAPAPATYKPTLQLWD
jgi:phage tail protein X